MEARITRQDGVMNVVVEGEINTLTAPSLAEKLADLGGVSQLIFELERVPYVSSAGLRLFLACQRAMNASGGDMRLRGCSGFMREIFESVGYDRIMKLEPTEAAGGEDAETEQ